MISSELMGIQQNISFVSEGYTNLGETLKRRLEQLSSALQEVKEAQKGTEEMMTWLKDMKKTTSSWNTAASEKDSVETQLEQQKVKMFFSSPNKAFMLPAIFFTFEKKWCLWKHFICKLLISHRHLKMP